MESVECSFIEEVFEVLFTRIAKELPISTNYMFGVPDWIRPHSHFPYRPYFTRQSGIVACPYAELGGRWGECFADCRDNYVFVTIALYLPTEVKCGAMVIYGEYDLFGPWKPHRHTCSTILLKKYTPVEVIITHRKNFLLDFYIIGCNGIIPDKDAELPLTQETLELVGAMLAKVKHRSNPRICFVSLNRDVPFLTEIISLLPRHRQYDTEVARSPGMLDLLHRNQQHTTERYGKTLSVASRCLDDLYAALEIDSFDEFRFHRATNEKVDGTGFLEGVKKGLEKRSTKENVRIVIDDLSYARHLFGSVEAGDEIVDGDVAVKIEPRRVVRRGDPAL